MEITFAGKAWADLRPDQKAYVQHCLFSWRAFSPYGYWTYMLNRAIKKAKQNLP